MNLVSEYLWKGDVSKQPLLGPASTAVSDAGHLAVLVCGFVQALVTVHVLQGQLLRETGKEVLTSKWKTETKAPPTPYFCDYEVPL